MASAPLCGYAGHGGVYLKGLRSEHSPKGVGFPPAEIQTKGKDYIAVKTPEYGTGGGGELTAATDEAETSRTAESEEI